jgi:hypothetical protein
MIHRVTEIAVRPMGPEAYEPVRNDYDSFNTRPPLPRLQPNSTSFLWGGLCIALFALALRAVEEGLKPKAEIERYRHYQSAARRALEEFDKGDTRSKLEAAKSLERAAYDEMAIFLKSYEEAGFKM